MHLPHRYLLLHQDLLLPLRRPLRLLLRDPHLLHRHQTNPLSHSFVVIETHSAFIRTEMQMIVTHSSPTGTLDAERILNHLEMT